MPTAQPTRPETAHLTLPDWLWGHKPTGLLDAAELHYRSHDGGYLVQTREQYLRHTRAGLINSGTALSADGATPALHTLTGLTDDDIEAPLHQEAHRLFADELNHIPGSLSALIHYIQMRVSVAPTADLIELCKVSVQALAAMPFTEEPDEHPMALAGAYSVLRDESLLVRFKLAALILRLNRDQALADGDLAAYQAALRDGDPIFAASSGLSEGVRLLDAYLTPLLACLSPTVWAFAAQRAHGAIVFTYGRPLTGKAPASDPGGLLATIHTDAGRLDADDREPRNRTIEPFTNPDAPGSAIHWWADALDSMFSVLSDPAVFATQDGTYSPDASLHALLSVEQVFRRTASALLAYDDTHARRAAAFTGLDTLSSLTATSLHRLLNHDHATKTLHRLTDHLPAAAAEVLLPAARRAVDALARVQDGFFMRGQATTVTIAGKSEPLADAAAKYLVTLRNATHGFSAGRTKSDERIRNADLLAVHDGAVPSDVGLLVWLYLLDLLTHPDVLRNVLRSDVRRAPKP